MKRSPRRKKARLTFAQEAQAIDDPTGPLGIRLLIQTEGEAHAVRSDRPALVVPLGSAIVEAGGTRVDRITWWLVPAKTTLRVAAKSLVAQTLVLSVAESLVTAVVRAYRGEIDPRALARHLTSAQLLPRTNWVNEVCHRYLFERATCGRRDNDATRFLEMELVKEIYFLCHEQKQLGARPSIVAGKSEVLQKALRYIEAHLFDADVLAGLAKASGASTSTLLRTFQRQLGQAPLTYVRTRRLDEALLLLKSGRYTVSEVSLRVGYQNLSAFASAFRKRFGNKPSATLGGAKGKA